MAGQREPDTGFAVLAAVFAGTLVIAAVLAAKIIQIGPLAVPAGVLAFALTFPCTDVIAEIYGRRSAYRVVLGGFCALLLALGLIQLALAWPAAGFWQGQEAFAQILGTSQRVIVASVLAYIASQVCDVWLFARLRRATNGRFLWLRNNVSTALAQLVDSVVFITVAFLGSQPVAALILGQWAVKLVIAAGDTPVVYLLVHWLRGSGPPPATARIG